MRAVATSKKIIALVALGVASLVQQATAIPVVNINDTTGPITVTGSGFVSFSSGTIGGNPEAVWWLGTVNPLVSNLGVGTKYGIWTEPGSTQISDEFVVSTLGAVAGGVFLSDPAIVPTSFAIPGFGTIDLSKFTSRSTSVETGLPTQISPDPTRLSVWAVSSVPDGASTSLLLGLSLTGMACLRRWLPRTSRH
jgi:hypothetical protein